MAKQRASLPLPRSSASDISDSSSTSTGSNINVEGDVLSGSQLDLAGSHISTPPTSVPEDNSISDVTSDNHSSMMQKANEKVDDDTMSRRSSLRQSRVNTYNIAALSGVKRNKSVENLKAKDLRSFSGQTLVDDAEPVPMMTTSADTPRRKLLDDGLKTLDMDWDVGELGGEPSAATIKSPPKSKKRKSITFEKITEVVTKVANKVLGKRTRDDAESSTTAARRQSSRISTMPKSLDHDDAAAAGDDDDDDEEVVQRPSKMARVASNFSISSLSSTFHLTKTKPPVTKPGKPAKRYQKQGLYVGQNPRDYKSEGKKSKSRPTSSHSSTTTDVQSSKQPVMPLPMFDYMDRERPFTIPYGIFAPQFRGRGEEKPKDWGKINKNRFVGDAKEAWITQKLPSSLCICKPGGECGDDCWNRVMGHECDDRNCNSGPECGNRDFEELSARMARANKYDKKTLAYLYNAGVEVIKTSDRGFGVRACRSFEPGEIITEYTGEIITQEEAHRRVTEEYSGKSVSLSIPASPTYTGY